MSSPRGLIGVSESEMIGSWELQIDRFFVLANRPFETFGTEIMKFSYSTREEFSNPYCRSSRFRKSRQDFECQKYMKNMMEITTSEWKLDRD